MIVNRVWFGLLVFLRPPYPQRVVKGDLRGAVV